MVFESIYKFIIKEKMGVSMLGESPCITTYSLETNSTF